MPISIRVLPMIASQHSIAYRRWRRFGSNWVSIACAILLALLILAAVSSPLLQWVLSINPTEINLFERLGGPSAQHPLGTDELGRDLLARLLQAGQVSLTVGLIGAIVAAIIGTLIGVISGFAGGIVDSVLMRATDAVIALPLLPLLIVLAAIDLQKIGLPESWVGGELASVYRLIFLVALFGWTTIARLVRGATLSLRERDFVVAASALGASRSRIVFLHILPSLTGPIIVATTLSIGNIILTESVLSFLGLGIQPPLPSWGNMLTNAQELIWQAPQLAIYPGLLIFITVIAFNLIGDGLQDAFDPRGDDR